MVSLFIVVSLLAEFCRYLIVLGVPIGLICAVWIITITLCANELLETQYRDHIRSISSKCLAISIICVIVKLLTLTHKLE
jgi:hypothetical protein